MEEHPKIRQFTNYYYMNDWQKMTLESNLVESVEFNQQVLGLIDYVLNLKSMVADQIRYKKNKEFLYNNFRRIKRKFYHYRDSSYLPRVTVCLLYDMETKVACRGISLCSFSDIPVKEDGRDISEDRAIKAYKSMMNSDKIVKSEALKVINALIEKDVVPFEFKSCYNVNLMEFEKKLLHIIE